MAGKGREAFLGIFLQTAFLTSRLKEMDFNKLHQIWNVFYTNVISGILFVYKLVYGD